MHARIARSAGRTPCAILTAASAALLVAALLVAALPAPAHACSCAPVTPAQARDRAAAVFEGQVTSIERIGRADIDPATLRVHFEVVQWWKGGSAEHATVLTSSSSAACGYPFQRGASYVVYATRHGADLRVGLCGGTKATADADPDRTVLGAGVTPVTPPAQVAPASEETDLAPTGHAGCQSCALGEADRNGSLATLAGLALGLAIVLRRRRR